MEYKCRLKVILAEKEIAHGVFADKIGLSPAAMSSIVNGHSFPSFKVLYKIIEELDMDMREIWIKKEQK